MKEERTLCELYEAGFMRSNLDEFRRLVRKGKFVCRKCGRVAKKKRNLCKPATLK